MDIILHLGGNSARIEKTIEVAKQNPNAYILVSSEDSCLSISEKFKEAGIASDRYIFDFHAWDTVTNFTKTYNFIRRTLAAKLYVVTDQFHMRRALSIADMIYLWDSIDVVACPYIGRTTPKESTRLIIEDTLRALLWRLTGYLYFNKKIKEQRMPYLEQEERLAVKNGLPVNYVVS